MVMSPYNSKTTQKVKDVRNYRMQTLTASKVQTSTNLLSSNAKQANKNNRLELPLLSTRSASKNNLVQARNQLTGKDNSNGKVTQNGLT